MSNAFKTLSTYSFEVYPDTVPMLGSDYTDVTVLALMNFATVGKLGFDAAAMQSQISPYLPAGIPKDYQSYTYLMIQDQGGQTRFIAEEWIRADTIQLRDVTTAHVTIGRVSASDGMRIRAALNANGFNEIDIVFKN